MIALTVGLLAVLSVAVGIGLAVAADHNRKGGE
jgi:hypothetical protein